jgi:uncharacterized membrane protein YkoI
MYRCNADGSPSLDVSFASGSLAHSSAMRFSRCITTSLLLGMLAMSVSSGMAGDKKHRPGEHNAVREALQRGEVLPLVKILAIASKEVPGDVIEVELEDEGEALVYEIKILTSTGRVREVEIDARTGTVLSIEDD